MTGRRGGGCHTDPGPPARPAISAATAAPSLAFALAFAMPTLTTGQARAIPTLTSQEHTMATNTATPADAAAALVGGWTKDADGPPCAAPYPASLRFDANGHYRGTAEPPGEYAAWDVGTWRVDAPGRVSVSTANDAVVPYAFTSDADTVTFTAPDGCRFSYRRAS